MRPPDSYARLARPALSAALLLSLLGVAPAARAEFEPVFAEIEEGTSSGSVYAGSLVGFSGVPGSLLLGHAFDYSLTGPLQLDLGTYVGLAESLFDLRLVPGVRFDQNVEGLPFSTYGKAGLAIDLLYGDAAPGRSLGVAGRLAAGLRHLLSPSLGLGVELGLAIGTTAGDQGEATFGLEGLIALEYRLE